MEAIHVAHECYGLLCVVMFRKHHWLSVRWFAGMVSMAKLVAGQLVFQSDKLKSVLNHSKTYKAEQFERMADQPMI